ncbi:MAG: hypothetical protein D6752_04675 [Candidatus Nitrosothermus koennekii]|nr:MAG: hypothetical protein D6752_04675 [Candidatus Nitrosothermus koennekii]
MRSKNIFKLLKSIPKNKPIIVEWLDASTTNHAKIDKFPLPNYYVETRRRTTGTFLCLQRGKYNNEWHLILELDHTEELGSSIRSIPLCLIYNIIEDV